MATAGSLGITLSEVAVITNEIPEPILTDRFAQAFAFASVVHSSQTRKRTTIPYMAHLLGVASLVLEHGVDEDTAIAALLHDAAEDRGGYPMLAQIKARFGERVEGIVEGCTDTFEDPKPDWSKRKQDYIALLASADIPTCIVSVADKLHNARAILHDLRNVGIAVFDRFGASQEQIGWYYGSVADVLHRRLSGEEAIALAVALRRAIDEITEHKGCAPFGAGVERGRRGESCPAA